MPATHQRKSLVVSFLNDVDETQLKEPIVDRFKHINPANRASRQLLRKLEICQRLRKHL